MRYLITSTRTEAKVILGYDAQGLLCEVQVEDMPEPEHRLWAFRNAPLREDDVASVFKQQHLRFQQLNVSFQEFWHKYGYKVGKKEAEGVWGRMTEAQRQMAYTYTTTYRAACARDRKHLMHPATYLRAERWLDHT